MGLDGTHFEAGRKVRGSVAWLNCTMKQRKSLSPTSRVSIIRQISLMSPRTLIGTFGCKVEGCGYDLQAESHDSLLVGTSAWSRRGTQVLSASVRYRPDEETR